MNQKSYKPEMFIPTSPTLTPRLSANPFLISSPLMAMRVPEATVASDEALLQSAVAARLRAHQAQAHSILLMNTVSPSPVAPAGQGIRFPLHSAHRLEMLRAAVGIPDLDYGSTCHRPPITALAHAHATTRFVPPFLPTSSASGVGGSEARGLLFVDSIQEADVLCGRGGVSNHHVGNKRFRRVVSEMKRTYRSTEAKNHKTDLSRAIVDHVCGYGGRFIKKDGKTGRYHVLTKAEARKKTSQALRETKELKWTL